MLRKFDKQKEIDRKMKRTSRNKRQKGMTLIEITLVIAILLGLIAVLFIGISAYKKGADNAKCILQMATIQKLIISYGNLNGLNSGAAASIADLITDQYVSAAPKCPQGNSAYTEAGTVPDSTTPYLTCPNAAPPKHALTLVAP